MPEWIDIGLNLTHDSFDADRDSVIADAVDVGVTTMIVTGTSLVESAAAVELCERYPGRLYATAGVHPHHASEFDAHTAEALERLLAHEKVVAVGECGLDFFRNFSSRDDQLKAFERQLELAITARMPVFLHQRDAHEDMLRILNRFRPKLVGGVAHCFTGNAEQLADYLELGLYIGITGWVCDERRGDALREAVRRLPIDRVMLETDAPYLLPRDLEPKPKQRRNEPKFLPHIAARVAGLMGVSTDALATAAARNSKRLFTPASGRG